MKTVSKHRPKGCALLILLMLAGCASGPPTRPDDICSIFREKPDWYEATRDAREQWGTPIGVQMAIIFQESRFEAAARPPRKRLLGVIPLWRPSSAYGFGQVKDGTWAWYQDATGNSWADRDDFADVADFIGWYTAVSHAKLGMSKWDGYRQYLAYHEGHGGYSRRTYQNKSWLVQVAKKVDRRARNYNQQLKLCEADLNAGWSLWPF